MIYDTTDHTAVLCTHQIPKLVKSTFAASSSPLNMIPPITYAAAYFFLACGLLSKSILQRTDRVMLQSLPPLRESFCPSQRSAQKEAAGKIPIRQMGSWPYFESAVSQNTCLVALLSYFSFALFSWSLVAS